MKQQAERALEALLEGNGRFSGGAAAHPRQDARRRAEVLAGQKPIAAIVACADSRVPPEIVFDQGVGDLFVVRTAGNVLDEAGIGSLEYAIVHLGVPLVVVLGHTRCGAVQAALADGDPGDRLRSVIEAIRPAVLRASGMTGDPALNAVRENARGTAAKIGDLARSAGGGASSAGTAVVAAVYDIESGIVEILS